MASDLINQARVIKMSLKIPEQRGSESVGHIGCWEDGLPADSKEAPGLPPCISPGSALPTGPAVQQSGNRK